ncbi:unnamed protein product [Didymodactylos carnosus]|nr:unnamed protein product [Didymodactylos carnosus]CAF3708262.1 unnamed protein product [Didymodactylos carnosus]
MLDGDGPFINSLRKDQMFETYNVAEAISEFDEDYDDDENDNQMKKGKDDHNYNAKTRMVWVTDYRRNEHYPITVSIQELLINLNTAKLPDTESTFSNHRSIAESNSNSTTLMKNDEILINILSTLDLTKLSLEELLLVLYKLQQRTTMETNIKNSILSQQQVSNSSSSSPISSRTDRITEDRPKSFVKTLSSSPQSQLLTKNNLRLAQILKGFSPLQSAQQQLVESDQKRFDLLNKFSTLSNSNLSPLHDTLRQIDNSKLKSSGLLSPSLTNAVNSSIALLNETSSKSYIHRQQQQAVDNILMREQPKTFSSFPPNVVDSLSLDMIKNSSSNVSCQQKLTHQSEQKSLSPTDAATKLMTTYSNNNQIQPHETQEQNGIENMKLYHQMILEHKINRSPSDIDSTSAHQQAHHFKTAKTSSPIISNSNYEESQRLKSAFISNLLAQQKNSISSPAYSMFNATNNNFSPEYRNSSSYYRQQNRPSNDQYRYYRSQISSLNSSDLSTKLDASNMNYPSQRCETPPIDSLYCKM